MKVSFYHSNQIKGVRCGHRYFDVLKIGYKWVLLRQSAGKKKNKIISNRCCSGKNIAKH
ncbi:uncharacterized protein METZ01_LOCUS245224, partial [marine metagenome]